MIKQNDIKRAKTPNLDGKTNNARRINSNMALAATC